MLFGWGFVYSYKSSTQARFGTIQNMGEDLWFITMSLNYGEKVLLLDDSDNPAEANVVKREDKVSQDNQACVPCDQAACTEKSAENWVDECTAQCYAQNLRNRYYRSGYSGERMSDHCRRYYKFQ